MISTNLKCLGGRASVPVAREMVGCEPRVWPNRKFRGRTAKVYENASSWWGGILAGARDRSIPVFNAPRKNQNERPRL